MANPEHLEILKQGVVAAGFDWRGVGEMTGRRALLLPVTGKQPRRTGAATSRTEY